MTRYAGLTWDHPRGYRALSAAADELPADGELSVEWSRQPLEGFESHPIADLCERYDLLVLDHPHIGEAVRAQCLWPLDDLFDPRELAAWRSDSIGSSFSSYAYEGRQWALPLDAATQVQAVRADLLDGPVPHTWDDVCGLAARQSVALSLAGPHALLSFCSMAAALGTPVAGRDPEIFVDDATGRAVLDVMAQMYARTPRHTLALNPIGLLAAMSSADDIVLCPLVYGYVNYAMARAGGTHLLNFHDAPVAMAGGRHGSTLGGTGLAISRRVTPSPALLDHLRDLMSPDRQCSFIPQHDGQPSLRAAWQDARVNDACRSFYRDTAATLEDAWVRPRYDGFIAFQGRASQALREALAGGDSHSRVLATLQDLFAGSRRTGDAN